MRVVLSIVPFGNGSFAGFLWTRSRDGHGSRCISREVAFSQETIRERMQEFVSLNNGLGFTSMTIVEADDWRDVEGLLSADTEVQK